MSGKNWLTFEQMIRLDVQYARNRDWRLDLKIIFLTVPTLLWQIRDVRKGRKAAAASAPPAGSPAGDTTSEAMFVPLKPKNRASQKII